MKRFTILIAAAVMLLAILLQPVRLWGQERTSSSGTMSFTTSQTSPLNNNNVTFTWTSSYIVTGASNENNNGFKGKEGTADMTITIPSGKKLVGISKTNGSSWGSTNINVYTGTNSSGTLVAEITQSTNSYTITSNNTGTTYYLVTSASKNAWIKSLTIEYDDAGGGGGGGSTYSVTFNDGDGTFVPNTPFPNATTTIAGGTYLLPKATPPTGYTFNGWKSSIDNKTYVGNYTVSANVAFTAQYTAIGTQVYSFAGANNFYTDANLTTHPSSGNGNNVETIYYGDEKTFVASGTSRYFSSASSGYFMLGKSGAEISLPTFTGYKITHVKIHSSGTHSTSVSVSIASGSSTASSAQTWSTQNEDYTYSIGSDYQTSALSVKVTNSYNAQFTSITLTCVAVTPEISVTPTSLTGFTYAHGHGPSAAQSFAVSGSNLTANITVTAPTNYQVCLTEDGTYTNSVEINKGSGTVSSTNVYVRLKAGLAVNASYSGNVSIASTGATNKTVGLSGSVTGYTVTYDCNGGTSGCPATPVNNVPSGSYTLASAPTKTDYTFAGWNDGTTTYNAGASYTISGNVTFTAQWTPNFPSITITPTSFDVEVAGDVIEMTMTPVNIASPSYEVVYYTTSGATVTTTKPTWFGDVEFSGNTLDIAVEENDGVARHAYFKVKSGDVYSEQVVTVNQAAITVLPPTFNHGTGTYYEDQSITLTNQTAGASIYYTIGANPADPTSSSTQYSEAISVTETTKIKAVAIKNGVSSSVATAEYTIIHPSTITYVRGQSTGSSVTTRGIVTYISGKNAYIQDETAAICVYGNSNWGSSIAVGDDIVVSGTLDTYSSGGDLLEIKNPSVTVISNENTLPCQIKTVAEINSDDFDDLQCLFVQIVKATYNGSSANTVTQSGNTINVYGTMGEAENGDVVTFKGNVAYYNSAIQINNLQSVAIVNDPTISAAASLTVPGYVQGTPVANITAGSLSVTGSNLTDDITCTLDENSKFELYNGSTWTNTTTIAQTSGSASGSLQIRLKAGQSYNASAYTGSVTLSSTGVEDVVVSLSGSVTYAHVTYNGNADDVTDVPTDATNYTYNQKVTVLEKGSMARTGYEFDGWNTLADGSGLTYIPGDNEHNTFNITANTNLFALWQPIVYNLNVDEDMVNGSVSFTVGGEDATTAQLDQTVTLVVTPDQGYKLSSLTVTNDATSETVTVSNTNTFTMPASSVTVSAEFEVYYALTIDFESALNTYSNWEFDGISRYDYNSSYGGSYCGINYNGSVATTSGTITTKNKIASPGTLSFYVRRTGSNSNTAKWKVYTSEDNSIWTQRGSDIDATVTTWTEASIDLSSYTNVYVRIAYDGNNAQYRAIDDICLEYTPTEYLVSVSDVANGTITASDGTTTITEGNSANIESAKTVTLTAEGDATHMFSAWTVTGATVYDASSATTTFEMPAKTVTVSATFVECWTFTYNINGNVVSEKYAKDNSDITLPTTSEFVPEGYEIIGWTATEGDVSDPITSAEASQNRTLYAVFGKIVYGDFVKITSSNTPSDWTGYYLIVYNNSITLNTHSNNLDVNSYGTTANIAAYYNDNVIEYNNTTAQYMVKIEQTTNGYSIYAKDGYLGYNGATSGTGGTGTYLRWDTEFTVLQNEWTIGEGSIVSCYFNSRAIRYNSGANPARFAIYATNGQNAIQLFKTTVSNEGAYTHIYPSNATANANIDVSVSGPIVIESGATLNMGSYSLTNVDAAKLVIEDGAQLILPKTNTGVKATVKKEIHEATAKDATYWYAISSAVANPIISSATNIASETYDLYRYNEEKNAELPWENYKNTAYSSTFTTLEKGRGYLYRNASDLSIAMTGEINVADFNYSVTNSGGPLAGFNLIGNPYSHDIYKGAGTAIPNGTDFLRTGFYYMEPTTGKWTIGTDNSTAIKPNQGILVQTDASGDINMTNTNSNGAKYNNDNIMFKVANSQYSDETYAWFDKGRGLNKISHRNAEVPMIYISQNGEDYAIATMSDDTKMFSLNFKAMTMGKYTLSYKTKGEFNYLHVIDRLTGEDVDMLLEGEYSFVASPSDSDARFIVKLAYLPDYSDGEGDIFAYQNGSDIFVSGEGELQIFDVMGRFVMSERINGVKTISADELSKGVYVLRLVGNGMKTQKIVVK